MKTPTLHRKLSAWARYRRLSAMVLIGAITLLIIGLYVQGYLFWVADSGFHAWLAIGAVASGLLLLIALLVRLERIGRRLEESRIAAEQAQREWSTAFDAVQDPIFLHDRELRLRRVNRAYLERAGLPAEQAIGRPYWEVFPKLTGPLPGCLQALQDNASGEEELRLESGEIFLCRNYPIQDHGGNYLYSLHIMQDITDRRRFEERLAYQATHDALTGLLNRALFNDRLVQAIARAHRDRRAVAVLMLDLDRFKLINDSLGHAAGDEVLAQIARRLHDCMRESDAVGRLGGDEFVVALGDVEHDEDVARVAQKIAHAVSAPLRVGGRETVLTASVGIGMYPRDGAMPETLLANADVAMYRAKERGGNEFQFFAQDMNTRTRTWLELETDLRRALANDELELHFQPQVELRSGRIVGAEALVRWRHPAHGLIPPARFIPLAEDSGLIVPLGEWVLEAACRQARAWHEQGLPALTLAVNVSAHQLRQANFARIVAQTLRINAFDPHCLELEITESAVMHVPDLAVALLNEIAATGVRLALDDFGTGYSSLAYLQRFPVDRLKIDTSFVHALGGEHDSAAIVGAILAMGHSLGLEVVAEGVETAEQYHFLYRQHCDLAQGYYFGRPVTAQELTALLMRRRSVAHSA